jgi:vanillate/3-O-methylgallate O-demethylase
MSTRWCRRVQQLARRAARLARDRGAVRPVAPHGGDTGQGSRRPEADVALAINSFANFAVNKAKQFVPCSYDGYVIGDGILFYLDRERAAVRRARADGELDPVPRRDRWLKVELIRDDRSPSHPRGKAVVASTTATRSRARTRPRFSRSSTAADAGREVLQHGRDQHQGSQGARAATRHGGSTGTGDLGSVRAGDEIRDAILEAGKEFGLVPVGSRAYASNTLESGWIPSPLPAVYTGEKMKKYREWLPAAATRAPARSAAASSSDNIEDYYLTPYELGYGPFVKFDHDFIGREALEKKAKKPAAQEGDVRVERRGHRQGSSPRCSCRAANPTSSSICRLPTTPPPRTTGDDGRQDGRLLDVRRLQLQRAQRAVARRGGPNINVGDVLTLLWGEEGGGTSKPRSSATSSSMFA